MLNLHNSAGDMMSRPSPIGILGTGDFARSLAKRLLCSGYDVILGSRRPEAKQFTDNDGCLCKTDLVSTDECIRSASIIFVAVHAENYKDLLESRAAMFDGKYIIDVSNRDKASKNISNAEYLQELLPGALVVKAFNVISAYAMDNDFHTSSRQVLLAGNDDNARAQVAAVARGMSFAPKDMGDLTAARLIEAHPLSLFCEWKGPIGFSIAVFNLWLLYLIFIYFLEKSVYEWEQIFVKVMNKAICMTGITTLSATYLASSFAAMFQIYYGTKNIRFPHWLDKWLKTRKQLGLISFILIFCHVIMSLLTMSPTYLRSWYHSTILTIPGNRSEQFVFNNINWMTWKGEAANLVGILAFLVLCFVCATTLPSVSSSLNWREWTFVQSKLGHVSLFLAVGHVLIMGVPGWSDNPRTIYRSITFLSSLLPWTTLLLKFILTLPCIYNYVLQIRKGWERNSYVCKPAHDVKRSSGYRAVNQRHVMKNVDSDMCACASETLTQIKIETC